MSAHHFHPSILREYDIRGVVADTLSSKDAMVLGAAFGTMIALSGGRTVALGMDGRLSSPMLATALGTGLISSGMDVHRIEAGPTPMLYFADKQLGTDAAIMVTGSHNPPEYNGFKLVLGGAALHGHDIQQLGVIAREGLFSTGAGTIMDRPVASAYLARLLEDVDMARPLTVAWDAGNGAAGAVLSDLCSQLPGRHILLNAKVDGTFPAHHPDPTDPQTLVQLQKVVISEHCDLGIAFDGDGDRIGVVDGRGRILWGDHILILLAGEILQDRPGAKIITDVKASQTFFDEIRRMGGIPLMWRTGHSLIKAKIAETQAPLAGEMSGHIFFADRYYGYDDALYAAIRLLNVVARSEHSLAMMRDMIPSTYSTPEIRIPCDDDRKFTVVEEIKARLREDNSDFNAIDGVRVQTKDGWWLLRASNTQGVLVARCESYSAAGLSRLMDLLVGHLRGCDVSSAPLHDALTRIQAPSGGTWPALDMHAI